MLTLLIQLPSRTLQHAKRAIGCLKCVNADNLRSESRIIFPSGVSSRQGPKDYFVREDSAEVPAVVSGRSLYTHNACKCRRHLFVARIRQQP